ncbi:hypothetical protein [Nocardia sp. No.11]|uniref:hypothetical protein n=1 Tax=Nocardia sp. No.11 TaxID=3128861 RepID=UPI00319E9AC4
MAEPVAPADAEGLAVAAVKAGLAARSDTAYVGTRVPRERPARMCRVSLVGQAKVTLVHFAASLLVECWDTTEAAALLLAQRAYAILAATADEGTIVAVDEVGGIVNFPDPDINSPRYQFTMQLTIHGDLL